MASLTRRDILRLASATGLAWLLPALEGRAIERRGADRPKSLIVLWLAGGPSQLETWDPHPGTVIGGETKAIDTTISGAQFAADYPQVAPESPGDLFDATEIDEILSLRLLTLTDEEKRLVDATDDRARAVLERTESLGPEHLARLHGAVRGLREAQASGHQRPSGLPA